MFSLIGTVLGWVLSFFSGSTRKDEIALGRAQEQVAQGKADMAAVSRANQAAKEAATKKGIPDANDLDARQ